jgi:MscS family membrane protein
VGAFDRTNAQTIVPLIGRSLRVALGLAALLVPLSQLGYPVGTLLAGLGIGGIIVALAAQKTVENLFGSVSLAADRVMRVGDWVKFDDVQGTVERIGLRSTHIRTLDRTVVKVPNGRLAELRIESFGERDRIRFFTTIRLV